MLILTIKQKKITRRSDSLIEKYEFRAKDGEKIESSYREFSGKAELYLSCQVGCGVGCQFCACSEEWLLRDLSWKEIVAQAEMMLKNKKYQQLNFQFNGIGEPTNNDKAVIKAIKVLLKKYPQACVKITTTGANQKVLRKFESLPVSLAVSIHAPTDELREQIIETTMDIKKVVKAAKHFAKVKKSKVAIHYLLLKDFNDTYPIIDKLLNLLEPRYFRIKLFHLNEVTVRSFPWQESDKFSAMKEYIASRNFEVTEFDDIGKIAEAGCGQLTSSQE